MVLFPSSFSSSCSFSTQHGTFIFKLSFAIVLPAHHKPRQSAHCDSNRRGAGSAGLCHVRHHWSLDTAMPPSQAIVRDIMHPAVQNKTCQWQHAQLPSVHTPGSAGKQQLSGLLADSTGIHILKHFHHQQCNVCAPSQSVWHHWADTGVARPQAAAARAAGQARHGVRVQGRCGVAVLQPLQGVLRAAAAAPPPSCGGPPVCSMVQSAVPPLDLCAGPRRQPQLRLDVVYAHVWKQQRATTHLHSTAIADTNKRSNNMWRVIGVTFFCIWPVRRLLQIHDPSSPR